MWIHDLETQRFVAINDAAVERYGFSRDEIATMQAHELSAPASEPPSSRRPAREAPRLVRAIGGAADSSADAPVARHRRRDGAPLEVELEERDLVYEGRACRLVVARDLTRQRRAEEALRESERRLRQMLETVQMIAVVLDVEGRITFANEFLARLLGVPRQALTGRDWFSTALPREDERAARAAFLANVGPGTVPPYEDRAIVASSGERRVVSFNHTVLRGPSGTVVGTASIGTDVTEQRRAEEKLRYEALHDALTGLPNRTLFLERLEGAIARARRRDDYVFAVLFVDLDRFKVLNDSLGHHVGDRLLIEAGRLLQGCVGEGDTVARLGGDEFTLLLDDIDDPLHATRTATRIHEALAAPFHLEGHEAFTTASIGIALSLTGYDRPEDVLRDADNAMYRAKARGKSRHELFDKSMHDRAVALMSLETDLRRAVERGEFALEYQPIVSLRTGALAGFEALVRWRHPQRGTVPPSEFVAIAEETGLIQPIGRWVLREACAQMRTWLSQADGPLAMSVNLSSKQFAHAGIERDILDALAESGLEPSHLKLEITESVLFDESEGAAERLRALRGHGIRVSIDDFGTGYSSLSYLLRFPIDTLKIDRSFVRAMAENLELVRAIVTLARNLGIEVVAEGVEHDEQRLRLEALGCEYAQGFLFSRPMDSASASRFLTTAPAALGRGAGGPPGRA